MSDPAADPRTSHAMAALLSPRCVAVVGASTRPGQFGHQVLVNLRGFGFGGPVYGVHPEARQIHGVPCVPRVEDLPETPDLAVIVVRAERAAQAVRDCGARGAPAAVVVGSGFAETGAPADIRRQDELRAAAGESGIRLCGPNTLGVANFETGAVAFVSANIPSEGVGGGLAITSQSGGLGFTLLNRAWSRRVGVGRLLVAGNEADFTIPDYLEGLLAAETVTSLVCYLEAVRAGAHLLRVVEAAATRGTPVIMLKGGRSEVGERAAAAHTGALATPAAVFDGVLREAGAILVRTIDEAIAAAALQQRYKRPRGRRVAAYGMGGGMSVTLADQLSSRGLQLPPPSPATAGAIKELLPDTTPGNPFDSGGQFFSNLGQPLLPEALTRFACDEAYDMLVVGCMPVRGSRERIYGEAITEAARASGKPCVVLHYSAPPLTDGMVSLLDAAGIPVLDPAEPGIDALAAWLEPAPRLAEAGTDADEARPGRAALRARLAAWRGGGHTVVTEYDASTILAEYGVTVAPSVLAQSRAEAVAASRQLRGPLVIKALSEDVPHRAAAGAMRVGVAPGEPAGEAWDAIGQRVLALTDSPLAQVIVQEMQPPGLELLAGLKRDPQFGPLVVLGVGGTAAELMAHIAVRRPPGSADAARALVLDMLDELDLTADAVRSCADQVAAIVAGLGAFGIDNAELVDSVDLNPVLLRADGSAVALDALIVLTKPDWDGG
jgi:acetate---CoA ligase (ADP-forming)